MTWRRRFRQDNMAEGLDSSIERLKKLRRPKPFIQRFLKQLPKFKESEDGQELVRSLISTFRKFQKDTMRILSPLMTDSSDSVEIQKKLFFVVVRALCLHEASEMGRSLRDLGSLPLLYEDRVNNGRSHQEDSHVSSGNNEGRLDDHSGSQDVRAELIFVPDGGGIEEPDRRETPGPITVISPTKPIKRRKSTVILHGTDAHGTNGLESSVQPDNHVSSVPDADGGENPAHGTGGLERSIQSVMEPIIWQAVDELGNGGDWKRKLEEFNLETELSITPSYSDVLKKITDDMCSKFPRLLQLRDRDPSLSLEDLKLYCRPHFCWSSKERVDFWSDLSDELFSRAKAPNPPAELKKLMLDLERTWQLHFGGDWIDKIGRRHFGEKWLHEIDESWIINHGRNWINKIDGEWIKIIGNQYSPKGNDRKFVRGLLRFIRHRRHHPDDFMESHGLRSAESFYNYLDAQFSNLLMVSYGVAYRFCKDESWFEKYKGNLCRSTFGRHAP